MGRVTAAAWTVTHVMRGAREMFPRARVGHWSDECPFHTA